MFLVLGIDGGGTKTEAIIADDKGNLLGKGIAGASNYHTVGLNNAMSVLVEAMNNAAVNAGLKTPVFKTACLGLAGVGRDTDRAVLMPEIKKIIPTQNIILKHDAAIALAGATACQPGVVVLAGTGSMAFGMNKFGDERRAGGWGNILGDEGSAYYISRKALAAACRAYDNRVPKTELVDVLIKYFELKNFTDIVKKIYAEESSPQRIASLAPIVGDMAKADDRVAIDIMKDAAKELALLAKAVIVGLNMADEKFEVAVSGSVFKAGDILIKPFTKLIKAGSPKAQVIQPKFEPTMGAVLLAITHKQTYDVSYE